MATVKRAFVLFILQIVLTCVLTACLWDNDTLSAEAKGQPELIDAIMGRIAVYPPEYYQFRIKRSEQIVKNEPDNLEELDNLIVAYDKLGKSAESYRFLAMKRKALDSNPNREHEYRYWANLGTVEAHEWGRAEKKDSALLQKSIDHLEKCIQINPEAHFGREIVQVSLLKLFQFRLSQLKSVPEEKTSGYDYSQKIISEVRTIGPDKYRKGIIGMMSLGGGPDSSELLTALSHTLGERDNHLLTMIHQRIKSLKLKAPLLQTRETNQMIKEKSLFADQYSQLMQDTLNFRNALKQYVMIRLQKGKHPDNDPNFWAEWKEPKRTAVADMESFSSRNPDFAFQAVVTTAIVASFALLVAVSLVIVKRLRKQSDKL